MRKESKLIHKGRKSNQHYGSVNPPIVQTSTVIFPDARSYDEAENNGNSIYKSSFDETNTDPSYGISGSETTAALQEVLKDIEGGDSCFITSSGLSAITGTLLALLQAGDHLLMVDSVYGPTRRFCNKVLKKFGIEVTYYEPKIGEKINDLVQENTKVIFLESPGSLTFEIQDIEEIVKVAKENNIYTALDNSWATPLYLSPLSWGVNISIHAITKYINGHSDLLLGAVIADEKTTPILANGYKCYGTSASPYQCYQALRGIRSMNARLFYQQNSLEKIISFLESKKQVSNILCPSYKNFEGYDLWKKYFSGTTSLFTIELDQDYSKDKMYEFVDSLELFGIGASWGGFESLIRYFDLKSVRTVSENKFKGSLVRLYIGLENPEDLIKDLDRAFSAL